MDMKTMRWNNVTIFLVIVLFVFNFSSCTNTNQYQFKVVDDISGIQLEARVCVTDSYGKIIHIDGKPTHVEYLGKHWCYTDGLFTVTSADKEINLEIQRGPETLPVKISFTEGPSNQIIKLHRWTDMYHKGFLSGDVHTHTPFSETAHLQMKAEDLNVLNILVSDFVDNKYFTGLQDQASSPGRTIFVAQEVRDWQMGHLTLLGLSSLVPGYSMVGGDLKTYSNNPHCLMANAMDKTHRQGALAVWSHFSNLPGAESPVAVALGKIDAIELMTYDDPTQLPSHWGPWKNSGMSVAEFPVMRGVDLYYQYLNSGFNLPIVAGTDKMDENIPMGSNRYYANTKGDKSYKAWLAAIKSGEGFITNGPMLSFQVDGHNPGDVINFNKSVKVHAGFNVQSVLPFATIEIIVNGWTVGEKTLYTNENPAVNGVYSMNLETDLILEKSSWIAARVADDPDHKQRILPRGLSVFAHTNPIYFLKDGAKVKEEASIVYLQKYVKGTINWLHTNPPFKNPEDRTQALKLAQKALDVYESLKK